MLAKRAASSAIQAVIVLALTSLALSKVQAAPAEGQKLMAVMSVITNLLLAEREKPIPLPVGLKVDIELGELDPTTQNASQGNSVFAAFELQEEGVEFCFDLTANQAFDDGDFVIEINGREVETIYGSDSCYQIPESRQREVNYVVLRVVAPGLQVAINRFGLEPSDQFYMGLPRTTRGTWDERAVRKVLKIFAFGGHARDAQIELWAEMDAYDAIQEMLNFEEHNLLLSPLADGEKYTDSAGQSGSTLVAGTLTEWLNFISNESSNLPLPLDRRERLGLDGNDFDDGYNRMITVRGLNPFRQRIGFWETNFHLATNRDAGVSRRQMARYYDLIMQAHAAGLPYHEVMGVAAKSAAVAEQYGHDRNEWRYDRDLEEYVCRCNDDFAREIHQLFYGIFGEYDPLPGDGILGPDYHENTTIPNTARMLTDMDILNDDMDPDDDVVVDFATDRHHVDDLTILGQTISGADASFKIDALMPISMEHPESLKNLPVMIIEVLADDNLGESNKRLLRESWASMGVGNKNFLQFIHAYAISGLLHSRAHYKYLSTHERALYLANKNNLDNIEAYFGGGRHNNGRAGRSVGGVISDDNAGDFFRPIRNVFGGQTGTDAADSALVFENNFDRMTEGESDNARGIVACDECDLLDPWEKSWPSVLPRADDGKYYVKDIAPWLWNHAVGSMDNYTELERAHLFSLLGATRIDEGDDNDGDYGHDFNFVMCVIADYQFKETTTETPIIEILDHSDSSWDDYCREYDNGGVYLPHEVAALTAELTGDDIGNDPAIQDVLEQLGNVELRFNETEGHLDGATVRKHARERVNSTLGFIFSTPFVFAEGQ